MARFRPILIRLLVAILLLQSGVGVAHCLRGMGAAEGMLVEICSTEGMRTIRLDANGEPAPEHAPEAGGGFCPLCHGLPGITLPEPPTLATRAWLGTAITWQAPGGHRLRPPARAPPYATRAPPVTA
ncbi:MAG: DUF2946 family protein [Roseococcus sp.]|nr:DUF2946 family protein [Roseococcus sp.]